MTESTHNTRPSPFEATVVAAYGRRFEVRDAAGQHHEARPQGRKQSVVCGDRVRCQHDPQHDELAIEAVLPRQTLLARANLRGDSEAVAANLTQLLVVLAPQPAPDLFVLDRYLCAATSAGMRGHIIVKKSDLDGDALPAADEAAFEAAGYTISRCSASTAAGLDGLRRVLGGETSALVGQSGVGKSSLVAALLPHEEVTTGTLTTSTEGRHTTTASRMYYLTTDSRLIDSPGVRDYAPALDQLEQTTLGFIEIARLAPTCRFQDCRHMQEPDCAVQAAVADGSLQARRYESYRRLRRLQDEFAAQHVTRGRRGR